MDSSGHVKESGDEPAGIDGLIERAAGRNPRAPALVSPGRPPLSYDELRRLIGSVTAGLGERGIGPRDRVALLIENGPVAASAFLTLACAAVCAPLNPAYRRDELDFSLDDLGTRAVVVQRGLDSPVREVARNRGIEVIELEVDPGAPAGLFTLDGRDAGPHAMPRRDPGDHALLLHTSGTTSRPKLVPLTHRNLAASARNVAATLELEPGDRCLNLMPLFHIHGLIASLLASLEAGGSVGCTPGFHPIRAFEWLSELAPTWTTGVPTMHQALLARCSDHPEVVSSHTLRFVRSSSASLPVPVFRQLEDALGVPVIEAYGMTEAAHQMTSNRLPPGRREGGSVGRAAGPEVGVLDARGELVPPGVVGEVAIRGENVFAGYEANPEANAAAFVDGWFRTGDQGSLDEEGCLVLRGRLKELINRGGEKIAPLEVDERLLAHPAVAQAVTFGVPDPRLGEEVAAAVVLVPGGVAEEASIQDFAAQTLAPFKVPRWIAIVDEIPKGPTGKLQRIGLAGQLGLAGPGDAAASERLAVQRPPGTVLERSLARIWADVLQIERIWIDDDFFSLGGDSILAAEAVARIRELTGRDELPIVSIVRAPTVAAMVGELGGKVPALQGSGLIPIVPNGSRTPFFFVHGGDGEVLGFVPLARRAASDRPFYALRARGLDDGEELDPSVEAMAARYLGLVRSVQPNGPYLIGGFCFGSCVAVEMANRLEAAGEEVSGLILLDPRFPRPRSLRYLLWVGLARARQPRRLAQAGLRRIGRRPPLEPLPEIVRVIGRLRERYRPRPCSAPSVILLGEGYDRIFELPRWYLTRIVRGASRLADLPVRHDDMFKLTRLDPVAAELRAALDEPRAQ